MNLTTKEINPNLATGNAKTITAALLSLLLLMVAVYAPSAFASDEVKSLFRRIPTQFIAALGDPTATAGGGAQDWGLWTVDPGPRGVKLKHYDIILADGGFPPARWQFDENDWWLEENGLIMEQPQFPLPPGKYVVTGDREAVSILTVHAPDDTGDSRWELSDGANLYDVTHLGCRSARYTPAAGANSCSPRKAPQDAFRVAAGAAMPPVEGCLKQDYHVLFIVGVEVDS